MTRAVEEHDQSIDWARIEVSDAFRELTVARNRAVLRCAGVVLASVTVFVLVMAFAHDFGGRQLVSGVTVAYALGILQPVVGWLAIASYLRRSRTEFDPAEERIVAEASA